MKWWLRRDPELEHFLTGTIALFVIAVIALVCALWPEAPVAR